MVLPISPSVREKPEPWGFGIGVEGWVGGSSGRFERADTRCVWKAR